MEIQVVWMLEGLTSILVSKQSNKKIIYIYTYKYILTNKNFILKINNIKDFLNNLSIYKTVSLTFIIYIYIYII